MGKKPFIAVTYENERISIKKKNSLPYIKCVLHLSCVVYGPIYDRFMSCTTVNGSLSIYKPYILILIISQARFENKYGV